MGTLYSGYVMFCWIYGVCNGGYAYTLKMYIYEKVRARNFARAWSFTQMAMGLALVIGLPLSSVVKRVRDCWGEPKPPSGGRAIHQIHPKSGVNPRSNKQHRGIISFLSCRAGLGSFISLQIWLFFGLAMSCSHLHQFKLKPQPFGFLSGSCQTA